MKRMVLLICVLFACMMFSGLARAALTGKEAHEKYLYPVVRVSTEVGTGSGTIVYSGRSEKETYSTYVLTNHHVINDGIKIEEEWDSNLKKSVKTERRSIVYVEIFKYRNIATSVGTMKIEADIVAYTKSEDMALLKLRYDDPVQFVSKMGLGDYKTFDETVAVGCSLAFPPLPTIGEISRLGIQIDSLQYDMSSAQIIYGNSGGAMFLAATGELIGIPSMVAVAGWFTPIPHMGVFIPITRVKKWLESERYDFVFNPNKTEKECLKLREEEIASKQKNSDVK
uniref:Putative trypsin-like peptidase domain containing protein n=2 Tax=viral metagenome TaxID=1070528 RepID=A0A6H2A2Y2_9ZZZZ